MMPLAASSSGQQFGGPYRLLAAWRERRFAAICCRRLLALLKRVAAAQPGLQGAALYRQVVAQHLGGDVTAAARVIDGAEASYAIWPVSRALTFRDVVHYLAVTGYCHAQGGHAAISSDVRPMIDAVIPTDL
jgi:hypothetical protein